jgi:hypothetical protein
VSVGRRRRQDEAVLAMLHDTDLIAIDGVGAFAASLVLSALALAQVRTMREQADVAKKGRPVR